MKEKFYFVKLIKMIWRKWLPIAQAIGNFQAQVILTIFYIVLLWPLGLILRLLADPLRLRVSRRSNFQEWEHSKQSLEEARRQY